MVKAADPVDVALVLVDDVSGSINDDEYKLEKQGYYEAFTSPGVVSAIQGGPIGAIAVMFVEFAGSGQVENVVNWTVVRDARLCPRLRAKDAGCATIILGTHGDRRRHHHGHAGSG